MNRGEFIRQESETRALDLESDAKSIGLEVKDYYMIHQETKRESRNKILRYINDFLWMFVIFAMGTIYGLIKMASYMKGLS